MCVCVLGRQFTKFDVICIICIISSITSQIVFIFSVFCVVWLYILKAELTIAVQ